MALAELDSPEFGEPLPRRKPLTVPEVPQFEIFGADLDPKDYEKAVAGQLGNDALVSSTYVRYFIHEKQLIKLSTARDGKLPISPGHDALLLDKASATLDSIQEMPSSTKYGGRAIGFIWCHPEMGNTLVIAPLSHKFTQLWLPPTAVSS